MRIMIPDVGFQVDRTIPIYARNGFRLRSINTPLTMYMTDFAKKSWRRLGTEPRGEERVAGVHEDADYAPSKPFSTRVHLPASFTKLTETSPSTPSSEHTPSLRYHLQVASLRPEGPNIHSHWQEGELTDALKICENDLDHLETSVQIAEMHASTPPSRFVITSL